jgi:hypothetical protein
MTRRVRSWALAAVAAFALAGAATPSLAGITYNVTNYADGQNGWTLAGTITASGEGTFTNDASAITAWDITASKEGSASQRYSNSTSASSSPRYLSGTLNATSTTLSLAANSTFTLLEDPSETVRITWGNSRDYGAFIDSFYSANSESGTLWAPVTFSPIVDGAWTLGTATPSAVPEIDPAMGGSALSLVAGVLAMIEQRRRRAMLVA